MLSLSELVEDVRFFHRNGVLRSKLLHQLGVVMLASRRSLLGVSARHQWLFWERYV